jgi:inorganic phosphate transporter, PiT family
MILPILGGAYLGWSLGANDASNVFGTAVTSRLVRFGTAAVLCAGFVLVGAVLQGSGGIHTLGGLTTQTALTAGLTAIAAAVTVTIMTLLKLPISTSQAVVGAILGVGLMQGDLNTGGLGKVVACWVGTPVGAALLAMILYPTGAWLFNRLKLGMYRQDALLRAGLIIVGCYGAYALGANNVANVASMFLGAEGLTAWLEGWLGEGLAMRALALLGGLFIGLGVLTFSRRVMDTVGKGIVKLDGFSSLVVVTAEAVTVHVYAMVGVPVSTSQAVIGAVLGVGVIRGIRSLRLAPLRNVALGWVLTPGVACAISAGLYFLIHLRYVG